MLIPSPFSLLRFRPLVLGLLLFSCVLTGALLNPQSTLAQAIDAEAAREQILDGVTLLANPTQPGKMVVFGDDAYSIANYKDKDHREPMIAAAGWGTGRVLAMGDHQWLNMDTYGDVDDTGTLYLNGIAWLAGSADKNIKIVVTQSTNAATWLGAQGFTNVVQSSNYADELVDADLLIGWLGSSVSQADLDTISGFVTNGGGLFLVDYGVGYRWWWNTELPESPGNILLRDVGIGFSSDWPNGTLEMTRATGQTTATDILGMLDDPSAYTTDELDIGGAVLTRMYQVLPQDDLLTTQLDVAYNQRIHQINPTPLTPVTDSFDKALLTRESLVLAETPVEEVTVHRLAETLYGSVPVTATRVNQTVSLDTSQSRWHPTGLFAAPGEVATITVPAELVSAGVKVRINAHSDNISPRSGWERPPIVHRWFDIEQQVTPVASAFGGLIFIDFGSTPLDIGQAEIQIENAVEAPFFVLGQHTDDEWNSVLRRRPAPFAVLVSPRMIISLPTRHIEEADLTEPTALMAWWDRTVSLQDDLADQAQFRTSPELANVDVQISAGAAHAGYPYQAYERHWGNMADWVYLSSSGSWGDFHELGHNHQRGWWTFDGDVEVTVNIFSNYSVEMQGSQGTGGWYWSADPVAVIEEATSDVSVGGTYASKLKRWSFWFQLADGFGWDAYRQVFSGYEDDYANNPSALPETNQDEKDQWLVRYSNQVGYDMSCFMVDVWGLEVTQAAENAVDHLPCWMPIAGGHLDATIPKDGNHLLDIAGAARSMDSVATVVAVEPPSNGSLGDNGDGTWTYTPSAGFTGVELISYALASSAGNTQTFTVTVEVTNQGALMETWFDVSGSAISDLTSHSTYPQDPDDVQVIPSFETAVNRADNFGTRIRAWLRPPTSGDYTFWTASDDASVLRLSSDANANNAVQIAEVTGWTDQYEWEQNEAQQSDPIALAGGKRYYIEAIIKEGGGGDHLAIAWAGPGIERQVIRADYLQPYSTNVQFYLPIAQADDVTIIEEGLAVIHPLANDSDADGDPLTLASVLPATNGILSINGSALTYAPTVDFYGLEQITYAISDSNEGMVTGTIAISVMPINDPPNFVPGADVAVSADAGLVEVAGWATEIRAGPANEAEQMLDFTVVAEEPGLFFTGPYLDAGTGTLRFEPEPAGQGQSIVAVQLVDDGGVTNGGVDSSLVQTFTIDIMAAPTPMTSVTPTSAATLTPLLSPTPTLTPTPSKLATMAPTALPTVLPTSAATPVKTPLITTTLTSPTAAPSKTALATAAISPTATQLLILTSTALATEVTPTPTSEITPGAHAGATPDSATQELDRSQFSYLPLLIQ